MLQGAYRVPDSDQPAALVEFNRLAGGRPAHGSPLDVRAVHERFVADRPVAVPVATPHQPVPPSTAPQHVPEVWRSTPATAAAYDVHGQPVAVPSVVGAGRLGDDPPAIVVLPTEAVQEGLTRIGAERLEDERGVAPRPHIRDYAVNSVPEARGQPSNVGLNRHLGWREG